MVHFDFSAEMEFILGGTCMISDTRGPIGMKLWGCVQFIPTFCNVNFSTSVSDLKPEIGCFSKTGSSNHRNRKSKICSMGRGCNSVV